MSDGKMIRKQLYITREQENLLKHRAREEGVTEAEVVRDALNNHLLRREGGPYLADDRRRLIDDLTEGNRRLARQLQFPEGYTFNRDDIYAGREARWLGKQQKT